LHLPWDQKSVTKVSSILLAGIYNCILLWFHLLWFR